MTDYNKLSKVSYNPKVRAWRFRVKIHRIYRFYSYVTNNGPFYTYVLADEDPHRYTDNTGDMSLDCFWR
ncbi:hypothetical protein Bca52824_010427 [Brassica carinata]|uniref:Uncharacterized protein n=1 Tax=Brassica carinata TaxID=52824 RepID=A0A8X8B7P1_BRACI|nr:hypothetical protein Bca52824_010427 [Brassica carinata]